MASGDVVIVDDDDYEWLSQYHWFTIQSPYTNYAARNVCNGKRNPPKLKMHREIVHCPDGMCVDHINHNGLDNRKENLRICTLSQNRQNTLKFKKNACGYKGVILSGDHSVKPYLAHLTFAKKHYRLGHYETAIEAAYAYDEKARELFGEFANTNFK